MNMERNSAAKQQKEKGKRMSRKKNIQLLRFLGMAFLVAALTGGLVKLCNYLLIDDSESYTRLTMHELYETEENIDTLFLGSSHCFRAYDPELYTELTGKSSFNLGSSSQHFDTSYYLLREAAKYHDLQTVYLDMHYKFLFIDKKYRDLVQANIISDYMKPSLNKLEFLTQTSEAKHLTNRMLPFRREWQKLADLPYIKYVFTKKQAASYRNYEPVTVEQEKEYYKGRGFVYSEGQLDADAITWWDKFPSAAEEMVSSVTFTLSYIEKIVTFCEEEDIQLVFVTAPSCEEYLEAVSPYDAAYGYIKNLADQYDVPYLDFNLCKKEVLDLGEESFLDIDHLNGRGAERITKLLAELDGRLEQTDYRADWIDEYFNPWYDKR